MTSTADAAPTTDARPRRAHESAVEDHVFLDPSGSRWRRLKALAAAVVVLVVALLAGALPRVLEAPRPQDGARAERPLPVLPASLPVIGDGPLVRVLAVDVTDGVPGALLDPFDRSAVHSLTASERARVRGHAFAMQRYGYGIAAERTLTLTFDDGPDAEVTPLLLDLLHREQVPATFFVTGQQVARHPELVRRIVREGHSLGNHTFSHPALAQSSPRRTAAELVATDRVIRAATGTFTHLFRPPYGGNDARSLTRDARAVLQAQRLGYVTASFDFDTDDWRHTDVRRMPVPDLSGDHVTLLLHDAGGDRRATLDYVVEVIDRARAAGYSFHSMPQTNPVLAEEHGAAEVSVWDRTALLSAQAVVVLPGTFLTGLFGLAVLTVVIGGLAMIAIACWRRRRRRQDVLDLDAGRAVTVSVVIAAFNEEEVIAKTISAVQASLWRDLEIVVVDDGSSDRTADVVAALAADDHRIRLLSQANAGKSAALNHALCEVRGDVVVTLDADTVFTPTTVGSLVRHFVHDEDGSLAAVAGVVKVGNRRNLLTRWQALEYLTQIGLERASQDWLGCILIVPGACAAWRRSAVVQAGGYTHDTLAEDFDLTLELHSLGYRIAQDDDAVCFTEAPESLRALLKQRTRWVFGSLQALWKHRYMVLSPRYGWLGMLLLPYTALTVVLPVLCLPVVYALAVYTAQVHGLGVLLAYAGVFAGLQLVTAATALVLLREHPSHLLVVPVHRLVYEPLRAYLLYKATFTALKGTRLSWNKLLRTGSVPGRAAGDLSGTVQHARELDLRARAAWSGPPSSRPHSPVRVERRRSAGSADATSVGSHPRRRTCDLPSSP